MATLAEIQKNLTFLGIPTYARGWTGVPSTNHGLY
jgi:hypothetical protein